MRPAHLGAIVFFFIVSCRLICLRCIIGITRCSCYYNSYFFIQYAFVIQYILYNKRVTTFMLRINFLFRVVNQVSRNVICHEIVIQWRLMIIEANGKIFACNIMIFLIAAIFLYQITGLGITAGAHRLWAHRSYKAKWPLQLLLVIMNTVAFQVGGFRRKWGKLNIQ